MVCLIFGIVPLMTGKLSRSAPLRNRCSVGHSLAAFIRFAQESSASLRSPVNPRSGGDNVAATTIHSEPRDAGAEQRPEAKCPVERLT